MGDFFMEWGDVGLLVGQVAEAENDKEEDEG